jgi:hypothetical protein
MSATDKMDKIIENIRKLDIPEEEKDNLENDLIDYEQEKWKLKENGMVVTNFHDLMIMMQRGSFSALRSYTVRVVEIGKRVFVDMCWSDPNSFTREYNIYVNKEGG